MAHYLYTLPHHPLSHPFTPQQNSTSPTSPMPYYEGLGPVPEGRPQRRSLDYVRIGRELRGEGVRAPVRTVEVVVPHDSPKGAMKGTRVDHVAQPVRSSGRRGVAPTLVREPTFDEATLDPHLYAEAQSEALSRVRSRVHALTLSENVPPFHYLPHPVRFQPC